MPWVLLYALSTFIFNHRGPFQSRINQPDSWSQLWAKPWQVDVPQARPELVAWARQVLEKNGITGAFNVRQTPQQVLINMTRFRNPLRVTYQKQEGQLVAERKQTTLPEVLVRMHVRTGYGREGWLHDAWAFVVDLVCVSFMAWVVTGLYLWWKLTSTRRAGWVAIVSGTALFVVLVLLM